MLTSRTSPIDDREQERRHPPVRGANHLDDDHDERARESVAGVLARSVTSWSICVDHGNGVVVGPAADARIEPDEVAARAHEVGERSDRDAADHGDRERER